MFQYVEASYASRQRPFDPYPRDPFKSDTSHFGKDHDTAIGNPNRQLQFSQKLRLSVAMHCSKFDFIPAVSCIAMWRSQVR